MTKDYKKDGNTVSFDMVISSEQIEKAMSDVYKKEKHHFQIPGFRKGKVPRKLLEASYGEGIFFEDAVNELIPEIYEGKTNEMNLKLAGQPNISLDAPYEKGKDVVLKVEVEVMPEFEVSDYSKIEIPEVKYEVTEDLIDNEIQGEREKAKRATVIEDRPAELGDVVVIDFHGFIDGVEFEGGHGHDHSLELGSNQFIPGFEDQLVGANSGDSVEVNVTFPEDYGSEDLAGKDATFDVKVNEIQKIEYPEIDDEFIKDISEFDTVDEYKADVKSRLEKEFDERAKNEVRQAVLRKTADLADFEVPEPVIENSIDREIQNFSSNLAQYGLDFEQYVKMSGSDEEKIRGDFRESAYINSKIQLVMEAIIEKEGLDATDDEVQEEVARLAETYFPKDKDQQDKFKEMYKGENANFIKDDFVFNKALDKLVENVVFVEGSEEETPSEEVEPKKASEDKPKKESTEERNERIIKLYATGDYTQEQLAEMEDLSKSSISRILNQNKN